MSKRARPRRIKLDCPDGTSHSIADRMGVGANHVVLADFDEIVVDRWLHCERMGSNAWWMRVGNACLWIRLTKGGPVVTLTECTVDDDGRIVGGRE